MTVQTGPLQIRRLLPAQLATVVLALGEPCWDKTNLRLRIGDGITLGGKPLALDANIVLTGVPLTPTAAVDTNTTQVASTAYVVNQAGSANPLINGTVSVGTSLRYARQDHVHPVDTSRAPLASPSLTGTPLSTTPAVGTNTTQIATAAMLQAEIANKRTWTAYTPTITPTAGTFTTVSATGSYMVAFGICHWRAEVTITTKGTGTFPIVSLPFPALSGTANTPILCRERVNTGKTGAATINVALTGAVIGGSDATELAANGAIITIGGSYPIA